MLNSPACAWWRSSRDIPLLVRNALTSTVESKTALAMGLLSEVFYHLGNLFLFLLDASFTFGFQLFYAVEHVKQPVPGLLAFDDSYGLEQDAICNCFSF